jgi:hypothetical protein
MTGGGVASGEDSKRVAAEGFEHANPRWIECVIINEESVDTTWLPKRKGSK